MIWRALTGRGAPRAADERVVGAALRPWTPSDPRGALSPSAPPSRPPLLCPSPLARCCLVFFVQPHCAASRRSRATPATPQPRYYCRTDRSRRVRARRPPSHARRKIVPAGEGSGRLERGGLGAAAPSAAPSRAFAAAPQRRRHARLEVIYEVINRRITVCPYVCAA